MSFDFSNNKMSENQFCSSYIPYLINEENVSVVIVFLPHYESKVFSDVRVTIKEDGSINLCELLKTLSNMSLPIENNFISYFSTTMDSYIHCGRDPIPQGTVIPASDIITIDGRKQVTVRVRQIQPTTLFEFEQSLTKLKEKEEGLNSETEQGETISMKNTRRIKERKIGEVIEKVLQWRTLYTGVIDPQTGDKVKIPLDEAANRVGIAKKSLDDYLLQLKLGKKYGFNFNEHYNEKIGVLRSFIKKHRNKDSSSNNKVKETSEDEEDSDCASQKRSRVMKRNK